MMKLAVDLQVCQSVQTAFRGIGRYSLDFASAVVKNVSGNWDIVPVLNRNLQQRQGHIQKRLGIPQDKYRYFIPDQPYHDIADQRKFQARLQNFFYAAEKCDIVHCSSIFEYDAPNITNFFPANDERIFSATLYDLIPMQFPERYLPSAASKNWYMDYVRVLKRQNLLLSISEATRKTAIDLLGIDEECVVNISSAIDMSLFHKQDISPDERHKLLSKYGITKRFMMYTAGFDARKNMDGLINAYGKLPGDVQKKYQLVIVCSVPGSAGPIISDWKKKAGIRNQDDVVFTGFVPDEDLVQLYNLTDLFVFPSLYEGFGLPIVEAIQCGAPGIGSDCSSIVEILDKPEYRFDPQSPDSIAKKIMQILPNPEYKEKIRKDQYRFTSQFTWDNVARRAIEAWENAYQKQKEEQKHMVALMAKNKPYQDRLAIAYFTPIPGQNTGIADFSVRTIEIIKNQYEVNVFCDCDEQMRQNFAMQAGVPVLHHSIYPAWSRKFDITIYQMGNNILHQFMLPYMKLYPGIVELHDFFIGHLFQSIPGNPAERLAGEHGISSILDLPSLMPDQDKSVWKYPYNHWCFEQQGVVVHSSYARNLANKFYSYGYPAHVFELTLPRRTPVVWKRDQTFRNLYHIPEDAFLISSLGFLSKLKKIDVLCSACRELIKKYPEKKIYLLLGGNCINGYEDALKEFANCENIICTGYLESDAYWEAIRSSNVIVQLRINSRGETSGVVQDVIGMGCPLILNRHGSFSDYPENCVRHVSEHCTSDEMVQILSEMFLNSTRKKIMENQKQYSELHFSASSYLTNFQQIISTALFEGKSSNLRRLAQNIVDDMQERHLNCVTEAASIINSFRPRKNQQRVLIDITLYAGNNMKTGIQRVVANITSQFTHQQMKNIVSLPVALRGDKLFYCREKDASGTYELAAEWEALPGDIFLMLDSSWVYRELFRPVIAEIHNLSGVVYSVVYDILPVLKEELFPPDTLAVFKPWIQFAAENTDGFLCISKTVRDELKDYLMTHKLIPRGKILLFSHFYLGSDFASNNKTEKPDAVIRQQMDSLQQGVPVLLSIGTIEPRKNHCYMYKVMQKLWQKGIPAVWIVVGKKGWFVYQSWLNLLKENPFKKNLFFFEKVNDATLNYLYHMADFIFSLSIGEGYGLPLVEAGLAGKKVICSDIPVFHELDSNQTFSFCPLDSAEKAAAVLEEIIKQPRRESKPSNMAKISWKDSADMLRNNIINNNWDETGM